MNKILLILLVALLGIMSGCQAFRKVFDEPTPPKKRVKPAATSRNSVFPWSKSTPAPSSLDSSLNKREQELLKQYRSEHNLDAPNRFDTPKKDTRKWVFGY